jgi:aminoglycoside/choline kinase family phosphotransferase
LKRAPATHFDSLAAGWYPRRAMTAPIPLDALRRAVRSAFGETAVVADVVALHGDASTRRYLRLVLAGAPVRTAIVMLLGEGRFAPGSDELGGGIAIDELPFLNVGRWMAAQDLPVPAVYADRAGEEGLLLLEDCGTTSLWDAVSAAPATAEARFGDAVDLLVALQVAGARAPDPACYAFHRRFDARLADVELEHFVEHGIETRHGRRLPAGERAALCAALAPVAAPFATDAPVLAHRDFMAWNLQWQDGRLRLIDFQDALLAPDAYDLAALLTDRTTATVVDDAMAARLVGRFVAARAAAGLPVAPGLDDRVRRCALHRALKVIGRFHYLELVRGKPGYLAYLPAVYDVARRMLLALPELRALHAQLVAHVPELAA